MKILLFFIAFMFSRDVMAQDDLRNRAKLLFGTIPSSMPGSESDTAALIALGERLYFETALSGNKTQSCNSCHKLDGKGAGVDHLKTSIGATGEAGRRNAPSTWNAGFQFAQNWDGSAKSLAEQAKDPILNPLEMGLSSEKEAVKRLRRLAYKKDFRAVFPNDKKPLTFDNIALALAAFQRTLITQDRFDLFLNGDDSALSEAEKNGLSLTMQKGCTACHSGPLMGGRFIMKMGLVNPYENTEDRGKGQLTGNPKDDFLFKVPSLRNVANTAPYFHDGGGATLDQAVFDTGWLQLGIKLSDQEVNDISAFLKALDNTKPYRVKS